MSAKTAGYGFILEFSERFANRLVQAIFTNNGVPIHFTDQQQNPPGPISSRRFPTGVDLYRRYLSDVMLGYDVSIGNPKVTFVTSPAEVIDFRIEFSMLFSRELYVRAYDPAHAIELPDDPASVNPTVDYPVIHETVPGPGMYPPAGTQPVRGFIRVILPLAVLDFGAQPGGQRVTVNATAANLQAVAQVGLTNVPTWDASLVHFVEQTSSKMLTELLRNEVKEIDITPLFGALSAFGLYTVPPVDLRLVYLAPQRLLGIGLNLSTQFSLGHPAKMPFTASQTDFALQLDEGFFAQLIAQLYNLVIPHRYDFHGNVNPAGAIFLQQPQVRFVGTELQLILTVDATVAGLVCLVGLKINSTGAGNFSVVITTLQPHPTLGPAFASRLANTVTFYLLDSLISKIISCLFTGPVQNSLNNGLNAFLTSGALAFSFDSPVRNTPLMVSIKPISFQFEPGRSVLQANLNIH